MKDSMFESQENFGELNMMIRKESQADIETLLKPHKHLIAGKRVLDLACYSGASSYLAKKFGADVVIGIDFLKPAIDTAKQNFQDPHIIFSCQDIEKHGTLPPLVDLVDVVISFGCLYHLNNHHDLLKSLAQPNIEYLILDSLYGPETNLTSTYVRFEKRTNAKNDIMPKYVPNLAWFITQLDILGFGMDYVEKYYTTLDFSNLNDTDSNMRMTMRFFNKSKMPEKKSFTIDQVWEWSNDNLIQEIK